MKRLGTTAGCLLDTFLRQLQHWARLCAVLSRSRCPSRPPLLLVHTRTQCCHSSHLCINKLLSFQVCSAAGKHGGEMLWRFSASGFWAGTSNIRGARSRDMNLLLSLVKYLSVGLLLEILGFMDCSKGCWLILKAVFDRLRLLGLWSQQTQ